MEAPLSPNFYLGGKGPVKSPSKDEISELDQELGPPKKKALASSNDYAAACTGRERE